jgi:hypothetical protein
MPKALCYTGLVISGLILLIFGLDLATWFVWENDAIPFQGMSIMMDAGFVIAAGLLAFLSWTTLREQK